jgi:hypothetical protein
MQLRCAAKRPKQCSLDVPLLQNPSIRRPCSKEKSRNFATRVTGVLAKAAQEASALKCAGVMVPFTEPVGPFPFSDRLWFVWFLVWFLVFLYYAF